MSEILELVARCPKLLSGASNRDDVGLARSRFLADHGTEITKQADRAIEAEDGRVVNDRPLSGSIRGSVIATADETARFVPVVKLTWLACVDATRAGCAL